MRMVIRSVDDQRRCTDVPKNAAHVREEARLEVRVDVRLTILRAEDDVHEHVRVGVRHAGTVRSVAPTGLREYQMWSVAKRPRGSRPGLHSVAAPRLSKLRGLA